MFKRKICHLNHRFVWRGAVCLDDNRAAFMPCRIQQRAQLFHCDFLVAEIDRGHRPANNADDLFVSLRPEYEVRRGQSDGDPGLRDKIGTQQHEQDHDERNVHQWNNDQPAEVIFFRATKLHSGGKGRILESSKHQYPSSRETPITNWRPLGRNWRLAASDLYALRAPLHHRSRKTRRA